MIVPITPGESYQLWLWAHARQALKKPGTTRKVSFFKSDLDIHLEGIKGEYAVSKAFLLPYDPDPRVGGDKGAPDLVLPSGLSMQIKYRGKRGWEFALMNARPESFTADIGVLCWPVEGGDDVEIVGYITREEFVEHAGIVNYINKPGGERLAAGAEHMRRFERLLAGYYRALAEAA